jgi:hypothetical protein
MKRYEVTIPFTRCVCGWYTGYTEADTPEEAGRIIMQQANNQGFSGPHKKVMVELMRNAP